MSNLFTQDFRTTPYWWDHVPRPTLPDTPLPKKVDVAVIGSGYTGLERGAADGARRPRHAGARRRGSGLRLQHAQRRSDLDQHQARLRRACAALRRRACDGYPAGRAQLARLGVGLRRRRADRLRFPRLRPLSCRPQSRAIRSAGARRCRHPSAGPEGRSACRPARRAAQRARHRRVFRRRGLHAARLGRSGPLPSGHAGARAGSRRHRRAALPCHRDRARRRGVPRRDREGHGLGHAMSWSPPTAIPAG